MKSGVGGRLRDLYGVLFKCCRLLPDSVGRQNPQVLLDMLAAFNGDTKTDVQRSRHLDMFYGK